MNPTNYYGVTIEYIDGAFFLFSDSGYEASYLTMPSVAEIERFVKSR